MAAVNSNLGAENKQQYDKYQYEFFLILFAKQKDLWLEEGASLRLIDSRTDLLENLPNSFFHVELSKRSSSDDN